MGGVRQALEDAFRAGRLVHLARRGADAADAGMTGFVVGRGRELVALHIVSDRIDLDGYAILRLRDVAAVSADDPRTRFEAFALARKGERRVVPTWLDLSSLPAAIASIAGNEPLVVLHRERIAPGEVAIGCVRQTLVSGIRLRWITPLAEWADDATLYRYASLTRVQWAGEYERTLAMLAGPSESPE